MTPRARLHGLLLVPPPVLNAEQQKAVDTAAGASWQTDPHFDLDWPVQLTALPAATTSGARRPRPSSTATA